jgi:hypothetical protein
MATPRSFDQVERSDLFYDGVGNGWDIDWDGAWIWRLVEAAPLDDDETSHYSEAEALKELTYYDRERGERWAEPQPELPDLFEQMPLSTRQRNGRCAPPRSPRRNP